LGVLSQEETRNPGLVQGKQLSVDGSFVEANAAKESRQNVQRGESNAQTCDNADFNSYV
jgi:hypothetical protein